MAVLVLPSCLRWKKNKEKQNIGVFGKVGPREGKGDLSGRQTYSKRWNNSVCPDSFAKVAGSVTKLLYKGMKERKGGKKERKKQAYWL